MSCWFLILTKHFQNEVHLVEVTEKQIKKITINNKKKSNTYNYNLFNFVNTKNQF
jgi:hypothetical protein